MGEAKKSQIREATLGELLDTSMLPSGSPFELMEDTVEVALKVAEADDPYKYKEKLLQVFAVTRSVDGHNIREDGKGIDFLGNLLDADVLFLAIAWTAEMNDRRIKLSEPVPCPQCANPFEKVPLDTIGVRVREQKPAGPHPMHPVESMKDEWLPDSLKGCEVLVGEPTWYAARREVPENSWDKVDAMKIYRALSAIYVVPKEGKAPRQASRVEVKKIKMIGIQEIIRVMDEMVPGLDSSMTITCSNCGSESEIPFEQIAG